MDHPDLTVSNFMENSIGPKRVSLLLVLQVVKNLVRHSETESLVPIARTACQFMEEVTLSVVTKESAHNYKADDVPVQTIQLPGASFLTLTFDSKLVFV